MQQNFQQSTLLEHPKQTESKCRFRCREVAGHSSVISSGVLFFDTEIEIIQKRERADTNYRVKYCPLKLSTRNQKKCMERNEKRSTYRSSDTSTRNSATNRNSICKSLTFKTAQRKHNLTYEICLLQRLEEQWKTYYIRSVIAASH